MSRGDGWPCDKDAKAGLTVPASSTPHAPSRWRDPAQMVLFEDAPDMVADDRPKNTPTALAGVVEVKV